MMNDNEDKPQIGALADFASGASVQVKGATDSARVTEFPLLPCPFGIVGVIFNCMHVLFLKSIVR